MLEPKSYLHGEKLFTLSNLQIADAIENEKEVSKTFQIYNVDRAVCARVAGVIAKKYGDTGFAGQLNITYVPYVSFCIFFNLPFKLWKGRNLIDFIFQVQWKCRTVFWLFSDSWNERPASWRGQRLCGKGSKYSTLENLAGSAV